MESAAELLRAIAALLWPLFAFTGLLVFKPEIRRVLRRLRKGKILGQELELEDDLDRLELAAEAAEAQIAAVPPQAPTPLLPPGAPQPADAVDRVLEEAGRSPKAALLVLSSEVEKETRQLVASLGLLKGRHNVSFQQAFQDLNAWAAMPVYVTASVKAFRDLRNKLVHGHDASEDDVLRAIDSGIMILRALRSVPKEMNLIHHPGVVVYADDTCTASIEGVKGVILETVSPGGASKHYRIFPTTKTYYRKGMRVSWEWASEHRFGEAWYRDPDTGEVKYAWTSSFEFVGRDLDAL